jgi:hypothetical protein
MGRFGGITPVGMTPAPQAGGVPDKKSGPVYKQVVREYLHQCRLFASCFFASALLQVLLLGWLGPRVSGVLWGVLAVVTTVAACSWWYVWYKKSREFDKEYVTVINVARSRVQLRKFNRFTRLWVNRTVATTLLVFYLQVPVILAIAYEGPSAVERFLSGNTPPPDKGGGSAYTRPPDRGGGSPGIDLSRRDLSHAVLRDSKLSKANLEGTNLSYCDFEHADLRGASLRGASLVAANLRSADLSGAILDGADLRGADFRGARGLTSEQLRSAVNSDSVQHD